MANLPEPSSTISFAASSSSLSNGSSSSALPAPALLPHLAAPVAEAGPSLEVVSLSRLSSNLERLLIDADFDCSDAEIVVDGASVGVHRCILAARSPFFRDLFSRGGGAGAAQPEGGKPKYQINELVTCGRVGREALMVFLSYVYTGKVKSPPLEALACADSMCQHDACRPAINFVVELVYASSVFQIPELVSMFKVCLLNFIDKALVEDVLPILIVSFHSKLPELQDQCTKRVARSDLDNITIDKELPPEVRDEIKMIRRNDQPDEGTSIIVNPDHDKIVKSHEKNIKRIHRALDSDDVKLVTMLLTESEITLDDAKALHYAVAYCDSKVVKELLDLDLAKLNLKNERGYTPLHVAAMRREPAIILALLNKGSSVSEMTADRRNAVTICRRLTRAKDYDAKMEQGDRYCIDILEREMMRNPMVLEDSVTSPLLADDLLMKLLYLEERVKCARLFFPIEAKLAMETAQAESTSELDLNETPLAHNKRLRERVDALLKTVELGRRFFPHCSQFLDKILDEGVPDVFYLQKGTTDEQKIKRMRFCELKEDFQKAFSKDKARSIRSGLSSSSSSSSLKADVRPHRATRK